jgi:hypothetical protein
MRRRWRCHGSPGERLCAAGGGRSCSGDVVVLAVLARQRLTMTASTALARSNGDVQWLADVEESRRVNGESEGWSEAMGQGDVLACPGRLRARAGVSWAR